MNPGGPRYAPQNRENASLQRDYLIVSRRLDTSTRLKSAMGRMPPTTCRSTGRRCPTFSPRPRWLKDLGLLAWFLVGVAILLVGLTWLLALTSTITLPVAVGAILATVAGPLVAKLHHHGVPRAAGAALVLLGMLALGALITLMVFGGIYEQSDEIKASAHEAVDKIEGWMNDAGAGGTSNTAQTTFKAPRPRPERPCFRGS